MIKLFYDVETTGTNHKLHCIHELSGIIDIDGIIVEEFQYFMRPHEKAMVDPIALAKGNVTIEDLMLYDDQHDCYILFRNMLAKYVDRFNAKDKIKLVGFNNRAFDDNFLRVFFGLNNDTFYNAYFWSDTIDVLVLASEYL